MRQLLFASTVALTFACGIFACGGSAKPPAAAPPGPAGDGTVPPTTPDDKPPTAAPDGTTPPPTGCAREIAIRCRSGNDGCDGGRTIDHVCVPQDAQPGPPCETKILWKCPEDQMDGCNKQPAVSVNHVCVFK
jgi:hypothetical protein